MSIIIFDTETTGLPKAQIVPLDQHPQIIEFAGIKLNENLEEIDRLTFLCNPLKTLPFEITKITGIKDSDLKDKKTFEEHFEELCEFFKDSTVCVAHNISFDKYMMDTEAKRLEKEFNWPSKLICTVNRTLSISGYRLTLTKLYDYLFHSTFSAHRAMDDVEALTKCFKELLNKKLLII